LCGLKPPEDKTLSEALSKLRLAVFHRGLIQMPVDHDHYHAIKGISLNNRFVDIFIMFDEAQMLEETFEDDGSESLFIVLRRALSSVLPSSLFTFFLSTTGTITPFIHSRDQDPSSRISTGTRSTPRPYIHLGFDQLMQKRKIFERWNTLEGVTSLECVAHMGRPL
jgi:hypothetical protein